MKTYALLAAITIGCSAQIGFAQDPAKQSPDIYKVIFENEKVRVLDVHLKPGEKSPMHSHPDYLIYAFGDSTAKFTSADGKSAEVTIRANECRFRTAESHAVENTGKAEVHVLNIELKH